MKNYLYFIIIGILLTDSCTLDKINANNLNGKWILKEAQCYCFFGEDFNFNNHILDFDTETKQVKIQNNKQVEFVANSGVYSFQVKNNELTINDDQSYHYTISENQLKLIKIDNPMIADDELTLIYKR